ncbi:hypothetical protein BDR06DRAFT_966179 [Suillus hirtellus]|nr:hypothetical protein BDR06DRAFT_966179 [Suillus hirtellus]
MNGSSPSPPDSINIWCTWALTVTYEAGEYTEQKFKAEKTGGGQVIPSPNLDTDLVMACGHLADVLIKASKNPIQMQMDIARYSKLISLKDTGHNEHREARFLERCPPSHEGKRLVNEPAIILNASSAIIAWYLPDALTDTTQKEIREATDLLAPSLEKSRLFNRGSEDVGATHRCINLSLAWFQQGHKNVSNLEVSASLKGPSCKNILKAIARPAAITSMALTVMHPEQYWAGLRTLSNLRNIAVSKDLPQMPEALQYWASMLNTLSIISNWETLHHRDHMSIAECFNILTTVWNYSNAWMTMPNLQLEFKYNSSCMIVFSRRIVRHGFYDVEGDQIAWA